MNDYAVPNQSTIAEGNQYQLPKKNSTSGCADWKAERKCMIALSVTVAVLVLVVVAQCTGFAVEITKLKSEDLASELEERIKSLENITMSGQLPDFSVSYCATLPPSSPSGYYWMSTFTGPAVSVYCDMTRSCGGVTGGWMRVAHLDMTDKSQQCPNNLKQRTDGSLRTCVINIMIQGICSHVTIHTSRLHYSSVCGRIKAYQVGSPDTFRQGTNLSIGDNYVDGVSLTHGNPRQHIWTFAAGLDEVATLPQFNCPCTNINRTVSNPIIPSFVGDDYFCDTGSSGTFVNGFFYSSDPLWDGAGCGPLNTCCSFNTPPWFYKQLPQQTTDDIEMRVCRDQGSRDEDIAIERIDIFVR